MQRHQKRISIIIKQIEKLISLFKVCTHLQMQK